MSPTPTATTPARLSPLLWGLVLAMVALQVVKGLSLESGLYPLISYLWTYADGPMRRGLFPTLFSWFGYTGRGVAPILSVLHLVLLAGLVVWLLALGQGALKAGGLRAWLYLLFLASPFLVLISTVSGYTDPLHMLVLLLVWLLLQRGHAFLAVAVLAATALQHEMVLVLAAPLFLAEMIFTPARRRHLLGAFAALLCFTAALYLVTSSAQPRLYELAPERCAAERPEGHLLVHKVWDRYCERAMRTNFQSDFKWARPIVLPAFWATYGGFVLVILAVWGLLMVRQQRQRQRLLALLPLLFANYALVFIAWDVDRITTLGFLPAWLLLDRWLQQHPVSDARPIAAIATLAITAQLCLTYPFVDVYGAYRLLPPDVSAELFINPRDWTVAGLNHLGLVVPPFLNPTVCIDPRCP